MRATGFRKARAKSRRRSEALDANVRVAIAETVTEVRRDGLDNLASMTKKRSGTLVRNYKKALRKGGMVGLVGYITARARDAAFYARFIHDGTSRIKARPFHDQAVLAAEGRRNLRMRAALSRALSGRASPSSLGRTGGTGEREG